MISLTVHETSSIGKFIETEHRLEFTIDYGKRKWSYCLLNGHWIYVWGDENVLQIDSGAVCTTLWINLMPLIVHLNGFYGIFCHIFYHDIKIKKIKIDHVMNHKENLNKFKRRKSYKVYSLTKME